MLIQATDAEGSQKLFLAESIEILDSTMSDQGVKRPIRYREITGDRQDQLDLVMQSIWEPHRYRWCSGGPCACLGCSNGSGRVVALGFTYEDWKVWVERHPNPNQNPGSKSTHSGQIVSPIDKII